MTVARWRFAVHGRVQGVGFRRFVERAAQRLCLSGFVRNEDDGRVTGEAEGQPGQLQELQRLLARGPMFARVDGVDITPIEPRQADTGFAIER